MVNRRLKRHGTQQDKSLLFSMPCTYLELFFSRFKNANLTSEKQYNKLKQKPLENVMQQAVLGKQTLEVSISLNVVLNKFFKSLLVYNYIVHYRKHF